MGDFVLFYRIEAALTHESVIKANYIFNKFVVILSFDKLSLRVMWKGGEIKKIRKGRRGKRRWADRVKGLKNKQPQCCLRRK
jgi:hypothetical protein